MGGLRVVSCGGLDGTNPLGFLAAVGLARLLHAHDPRCRLSWECRGRPEARLHLPEGVEPDQVAARALGELRGGLTESSGLKEWQAQWPELAPKYVEPEDLKDKPKAHAKDEPSKDLKTAPSEVRARLFAPALEAAQRELGAYSAHERAQALGSGSFRRWVDFAAAFVTEVAVDNKGNSKPTALHFTAGQQRFLQMLRELSLGVQPAHMRCAIFGPWDRAPLPVMRWDASGERTRALLGIDPSKNKPMGTPGADWLAAQAMPWLPCFPRGSRVITSGFAALDDGALALRWPLWDEPLGGGTLGSLLKLPIVDWSAAERRQRGVFEVFEARVARNDHGYGSFRAPNALPAAAASGGARGSR
jgi:hypothetical protein